jgi:DNA repair exonuclease SbcCD ATPase subunit
MDSFHSVDVARIKSEVPRSNFSEATIDRLADLILESDGLVKPLIVKQVGVYEYSVINGDLEYYAAVRAKEKDRDKGEMVNAFVIQPEIESKVKEQTEVINSAIFAISPPIDSNFELRITNIELRFEKQNNELRAEYKQDIKKLEEQYKKLESLIPQRKDPLSLLNQLEEKELAIRLQRSKIKQAENLAKSIIEAREKKHNKKFEDYRDVVKSVQGLGDKTIMTIIDDWRR